MKTASNPVSDAPALALADSSALRRKTEVLRIREKQLADWKDHADRIEDENTKLARRIRKLENAVC